MFAMFGTLEVLRRLESRAVLEISMARKGKDLPDDRTRRLEALRDDCRRLSRNPIPLSREDGKRPEIGGDGSELRRAFAALDRLGEILLEGQPVPADQVRRDRGTAIDAILADDAECLESATASLLEGVPSRPDMIIETRLEGDSPGERDIVRRRRVPDVFAAIAQKCDALLGGGQTKPARRSREELRAHATLELVRLRKVLQREPTNKEIAEAVGVHPSRISALQKDPTWIGVRAASGRAPRAVNRKGEGVGLAEDDRDERKPNAIGEDFFDSQAPKPKRVSAKRRED